MLIQEKIIINNTEFRKTYSDSNFYIKQIQTGILYSEAVDVLNSTFTYEETDKELPVLEEPEIPEELKENLEEEQEIK